MEWSPVGEEETMMGHRYLHDTTAPSLSPTTDEELARRQLIKSMLIYGPIFFFGFVFYCVLRKCLPRTYAVRQWVPEIKTVMAKDQFGYLSWLWKVYGFEMEELLNTIGLDALCFLRVINMGFRLSCVACFNSIWLFAVYATAEDGASGINSGITIVAINHLPSGSPRFGATVLAAYIFFVYTMYTILKEFRWFIEYRHAWLRRFNQRNYTILVRNIPENLRSDTLLEEHFQLISRKDSVLEAHVCLKIPHLKSMVARRKGCIANLEHALAELEIKKKRPKHLVIQNLNNRKKKNRVDAIDYFTEELNELNEEISRQIDQIESKSRPNLELTNKWLGSGSRVLGTLSSLGTDSFNTETHRLRESDYRLGESSGSKGSERVADGIQATLDGSQSSGRTMSSSKTKFGIIVDGVKDVVGDSASSAKDAGSVITQKAMKNVKKRANQAKNTVEKASDAAQTLLTHHEDGEPDDAGFVTFTSLVAVHQAIQMSQHHEPFVLDTETAPDEPKYIFWDNVGKDHEVVQVGRLISIAATVALCLFWTPLVTLIVSLTDVESLKEEFPRLEPVLDAYPGMAGILAILSPLILLIFNSGLLPIILKAVSRFEFPSADSSLEASAFWKMSTFTILQTFFVSLVGGSLVSELSEILRQPEEFVDLLARALPEQSEYFMQLLMVSTCTGSLVELFRVVPLFQSAVRANIGSRLTEKERSQALFGMKPLCVVDKIYFSRMWARYILYFMVLFVYATMSPLLCWFCLVFFVLLGSIYRYQFVFNYPSTPDSGGSIWLNFMHVMFTCIMISQITLVGFFALKKSAVSMALMIPLIVCTFLFIMYLRQRHFDIGTNLPARTCLSQDLHNADEGVDFNFFKDEYKNPAMRHRFVDADWDSGKPEEQRRKRTVVFSEGHRVMNSDDVEHSPVETGEAKITEANDDEASLGSDAEGRMVEEKQWQGEEEKEEVTADQDQGLTSNLSATAPESPTRSVFYGWWFGRSGSDAENESNSKVEIEETKTAKLEKLSM